MRPSHDTVTAALPRLVGMNLKTIPATTDSRKATMKRTDEKDSPIASDACSSHCITPIKFGEPNNAVVLAMIQQAGSARLLRAMPALPPIWIDCGSTERLLRP